MIVTTIAPHVYDSPGGAPWPLRGAGGQLSLISLYAVKGLMNFPLPSGGLSRGGPLQEERIYPATPQ
jgi:hypothetical protein